MYSQNYPIKERVGNEFSLTKSEKVILEKLSRGLQYKEIAVELHISFQTVKSHVTNIYTKLKVNNRTEAMLKYLKFIN